MNRTPRPSPCLQVDHLAARFISHVCAGVHRIQVRTGEDRHAHCKRFEPDISTQQPLADPGRKTEIDIFEEENSTINDYNRVWDFDFVQSLTLGRGCPDPPQETRAYAIYVFKGWSFSSPSPGHRP